MDVTPGLHSLHGMVNQKLKWWDIIGELLDNSLDAGATRVVCQIDKRRLIVSDNGCGIKDIEKAVTLGKRQEHDTTRLGRFGCGLKDAWLWASNRIEIVSRTAETESTVTLDINGFKQVNGLWIAPDPVSKTNTTGKTGTTITIGPWHEQPGRQGPRRECWAQLEKIFTPAINQGRVIEVVDGKIKFVMLAMQMPKFEQEVKETFAIEGKQVDIHIGIVGGDEKLPMEDFSYVVGHRQIDEFSHGKGAYSGDRVIGTVTLDRKWTLTRNKNEIDGIDMIGQEIYSRIEHLLKLSEERSRKAGDAQLLAQIEDVINQSEIIAASGREKRSKGDSTGAAKPTGTGQRRGNAAKVTPDSGGECSGMANMPDKISVRWGFDEDKSKIYKFTAPNKLYLNANNDSLAWWREEGESARLEQIALASMADAMNMMDNVQYRLIERGDFMSYFSHFCDNTARGQKAKVKK